MTALFFDIDDTLYSRRDLLLEAAVETASVEKLTEDSFMKVFYEKSDINMEQLESGEISTHDINGWRYNETFRLLGLPYKPEDGGRAADAYLELQSHMKLSSSMVKALDAFSSDPGTKLAILTAGETSHQLNKVVMLGLDKWFDRANVIVTGDVGFSKPDVRLFKLMEERLDLSPLDLWMVGDNYDKDITGAIDSGWHSIWINRRNLPMPVRKPDIEVKTDEELTSLLISMT